VATLFLFLDRIYDIGEIGKTVAQEAAPAAE
jgi:hypothetical protein